MPVYIRMTSEDWRNYPAWGEDDPDAWLAANPDSVQYGPFDCVVAQEGGHKLFGHFTDGQPLLIAEVNYDMGWTLWAHVHHSQEDPRRYDGFEIVSEG